MYFFRGEEHGNGKTSHAMVTPPVQPEPASRVHVPKEVLVAVVKIFLLIDVEPLWLPKALQLHLGQSPRCACFSYICADRSPDLGLSTLILLIL